MQSALKADPVTLTVFLLLFAGVTGIGLFAEALAARRSFAAHRMGLEAGGASAPWSPGFFLGGDLYTAYTFIAVPALMFGAGAMGFFAIPYGMLAYILMFLGFARLWSVAHKHGYITAADFVRGRFGSKALALAVALTGIAAAIPRLSRCNCWACRW